MKHDDFVPPWTVTPVDEIEALSPEALDSEFGFAFVDFLLKMTELERNEQRLARWRFKTGEMDPYAYQKRLAKNKDDLAWDDLPGNRQRVEELCQEAEKFRQEFASYDSHQSGQY